MEIYDRDYYERGIETGKSCYQNYRWLPELTIPLAMVMIDHLGIKRGQSVLDYGCAFGYLVKALRLLGRDASGVDISRYAIANVDPKVRQHCFLTTEDVIKFYDFCISKDVFEHIAESDIDDVLNYIDSKVLFAVIPLGNEDGFYATSNNMDITHISCHDENWWIDKLTKSGKWMLSEFRFNVPGIKDSYYENYPEGYGFFTLRSS